MPDISMCAALTCPKSKDCYRHEDSGTKPTDHWQTYAPFAHGVAGCDYFWPASKMRPVYPTPKES